MAELSTESTAKTVWRICARKYAREAFSGKGAAQFGGRWNPPGVRVVYTSETLSLCVLESFVNLDPEDLPLPFVAISAEIPHSVSIASVEIHALPENWRGPVPNQALESIGMDWLRQARSAVLSVPSSVVPCERNYLLNPAHPDFHRIKRNAPAPFDFDPRMWGPAS